VAEKVGKERRAQIKEIFTKTHQDLRKMCVKGRRPGHRAWSWLFLTGAVFENGPRVMFIQ
jgi:hypothetical protein